MIDCTSKISEYQYFHRKYRYKQLYRVSQNDISKTSNENIRPPYTEEENINKYLT